MLSISKSQMQALTNARPGTQLIQPCLQDATWIEVQLVDQYGNPVPGAKYQIRLPDQSLMKGVLDDEGKARFDNIVSGHAAVTFPEIDAREWSLI